jgi:short subunit dehydrogenase-like uncharacterized protein
VDSPGDRDLEGSLRREGLAAARIRSRFMPFLLYGANGYSGGLIARMAGERGLRPILAGRNRIEVAAVAAALSLEHRIFGLDDPAVLDEGLRGVSAVLHCAGPFSRSARPMAEACLRTRTHYLDITGELTVFESLHLRDAEAKAAGVMLLPGTGFDVVPSDCLAAHLKARLPSATSLRLGFQGVGRLSRGTATTMVENLHRGGVVRRGGVLTPVPAAFKTRVIDFGRGPTPAVTIPWGDVSTAYHSTGIPDIEVYMASPFRLRMLSRIAQWLGPLTASSAVQGFAKRRIRSGPAGPTDAERARGRSFLWGEVEDAAGQRRVSRLEGPEGYTLTALTALRIVARVLGEDAPPGFQTPSRAYGKDFILEIDGTSRRDE